MHRNARHAALAAAAMLACAAPATAAIPKDGALYGGGAQTSAGDFNEYTTIRVAKDGTSINFYGEWSVRCEGGGRDLAYITAEDVALKRGGRFAGRGEVSGQGPAGSQAGSFRFSGRFTAAHVAIGRARVDLQQTLTAGGGASCTSGDFRFTAVDATQRGARAEREPDAMLYGSTSQTYPALVRLDGKASGFAFAALEYELTCATEADPHLFDERMPGDLIRLKPNGRFRGTETFTSNQTTSHPNGELTITARVDGRLRGGSLRGTWEITGEVRDRDTGAVLDTCRSERITFRAAGA